MFRKTFPTKYKKPLIKYKTSQQNIKTQGKYKNWLGPEFKGFGSRPKILIFGTPGIPKPWLLYFYFGFYMFFYVLPRVFDPRANLPGKI